MSSVKAIKDAAVLQWLQSCEFVLGAAKNLSKDPDLCGAFQDRFGGTSTCSLSVLELYGCWPILSEMLDDAVAHDRRWRPDEREHWQKAADEAKAIITQRKVEFRRVVATMQRAGLPLAHQGTER